MKLLLSAAACIIASATLSSAAEPRLHLRHITDFDYEYDEVGDLPGFFPPNMNKNDVELYLSHQKKKTSPIITVNKDDWLSQCVATFKEYYNPGLSDLPGGISRSNFYLINEPSGLCADTLVCAFDKCMADTNSLSCLANHTDLSSADYDDVSEKCNLPISSLPKSITFPKNSADVISAIKYAKKHNLQISIKSTGHSYFGAHTKAGSLMLNMRDYVKYASGDDKVIECDTADSFDAALGDACTLATARKKDAYIRVGGGQTWSEVYNAVNASNAVGNLSKTYGVAGGGAGSVGVAGGWLSGGGLSTGYEREHGLGVDQVLEFEVALPSGHHVRVFPTEWEDDNDFITPQTTKVTALCNSNIVANEDDWQWQPCTDLDVSPEDLWMALRGGGGGTYGITLSVKYQLFEQNPLQWISLGLGFMSQGNQTGALDDKSKKAYETIVTKFKADKTGALWEEVRRTFALFLVDFLFAPEKIGVSKEISLSCGGPNTYFKFDSASATNLYCWGTESAFPEISLAWNRTINDSELAKKDTELAYLLSKHILVDMTSFGAGPFSSFSEISKSLFKTEFGDNYDDIFPADAIPDSPLPNFTPSKIPKTYCSINLPLALLQSDDKAERELLFKVLETSGGAHTTGGNVARLGDGMDSVSPTERSSGQSSIAIQSTIDKYGGSILNDYLAAVYKYTGDDVEGFPGFSEYNHFCSEASTVSKTNWTESCDPKDEECFRVEELVWGEDLYVKLQGIKAAVDPDNLLDCYQCVKPSNK